MNQNKHHNYDENVWILPTLDGKLPNNLTFSNKEQIGKWIIENYKRVKQAKDIPVKQPGERFWHINYTQSQLKNWQNSIRLRFPEVAETEFMTPNSYLDGDTLRQKIKQLKEISQVMTEDSELKAIIFLLDEIDRYNLKANLMCLRTAALPQFVEVTFKVSPAVKLPVELQTKIMQTEDRYSKQQPEELFANSLTREVKNAIALAVKNTSNDILSTVELLSWQTQSS